MTEGRFSSRIGGRLLPAVEDVFRPTSYHIHCHELTTIDNIKQLAANIYALAHSVALISSASFGTAPTASRLPLSLVAYSMQVWRGRAWKIGSCAVMSGRQRFRHRFRDLPYYHPFYPDITHMRKIPGFLLFYHPGSDGRLEN